MILFYLFMALIPFPEYERFTHIVGSLSLMKLVGAGALLAAAVYTKAPYKGALVPPCNLKYAYFLFFILTFALNFSFEVITSWAVCAVMYSLVTIFVDSFDKIKAIYWITIAGLIVNCIQSLKGILVYKWYERAAGSYGDANYLSLALLVGIVFCYALIQWDDKYKYFKYGCMITLFVTMMLAASRGCILGLVVTAFYIFKDSQNKKKMVLIALFVCAPIIIYFTPKVIDRFENKSHSDYSSIEHRKQTQIAGLNMVKGNPLTGVGYGTYKELARKYNPVLEDGGIAVIAHNTYLQIAAELGIPALLVFLLLIVGSYRSLNKLLRLELDPQAKIIVNSLKYVLVGYAVSIMFLSAEKEKYLWFIICLVFAVTRLIYNGIEKDPRYATTWE